MTLQELQTKANTKLLEFCSALQTKQEAYLLKHGKCFQLLVTDRVVDGVDTTFEIRKPNDEKHAVDVDFTFNSPVPFQISVDEWVGGEVGYKVTAVVELPDGRRFTRNRTCVPTIVSATYSVDIDNPIELTPQSVSGWTEETSNWSEVIEETI